MKKSTKYFLIILPLLFVFAFVILDLSINNNSFGKSDCGCGDPSTSSGAFDPKEIAATFMDTTINGPLAEYSEPDQAAVLGDASQSEKWIEVDLSEQKLTAWDGANKFLETLVSTGKFGKTPTGEFNIWSKFKYTKMSGGSKELRTYYYLPNVPYTMYFYKGFGLHGTYWHNNFGQTMSHGCVNLPTLMAEKIYYWSTPTVPSGKNSVTASKDNPGTRVVIHD